jgi:hypothetical protein
MAIRRIPKSETTGISPVPGTTRSRSAKQTDNLTKSGPMPSPAVSVHKTPTKLSNKKKRQPTGDYPVGWCRAPAKHRFNGKPGPGRPKGSVSQDKLMRKHLNQKRKVKVDGKELKVSMRELLIITAFKQALAGKKELGGLLSEAFRLFPDERSIQNVAAEGGVPSAVDQQILDEFFSKFGLRQPEMKGSPPANGEDGGK